MAAVSPPTHANGIATTVPVWAVAGAMAAVAGVAAAWGRLTMPPRRPLPPLTPAITMCSATAQVVQPKIRGFICTTTHPVGCAARVGEEIAYAKAHPPTAPGPKKVLVIGSSTGYGLSTRIASAFGHGAATLGVFLAGPSTKGRPASAGWYNTAAFERAAQEAGLYAKSLNGDAFDPAMKARTVETIKQDLGQVDFVVYSVAAPRRVDPTTGQVYQSVLKPIGANYSNRSLLADKGRVVDVTLEAATQEEVDDTVKVMGGEDWELWLRALHEGGVLAPGAKAVAYSYIGPEMTWPVYWSATIGAAKKDVEKVAKKLSAELNIEAYTVIAKALVTQASSAIPVVPLYITLLYKVMKAKGTHEGCIEQMVRMLNTKLYPEAGRPPVDEEGRIRIDDYEMAEDVQAAIADLWTKVTTENLSELTDFAGYQRDFLRLFGFEIEGVDYSLPVEVEVPLPSESG